MTAHAFLAEWDRLQREERWPHAGRLQVAIALARDLETCRALLCGEPVDPARVDRDALQRAKDQKLVRLDLSKLDLLIGEPS